MMEAENEIDLDCFRVYRYNGTVERRNWRNRNRKKKLKLNERITRKTTAAAEERSDDCGEINKIAPIKQIFFLRTKY